MLTRGIPCWAYPGCKIKLCTAREAKRCNTDTEEIEDVQTKRKLFFALIKSKVQINSCSESSINLNNNY